MSFTSDNINKSAFPIFKMMMDMQRLGMQAMSVYQPLASSFLDASNRTEGAAKSAFYSATRNGASAARNTDLPNDEQVIGVGEEVMHVGTRMVPGNTTRVRRVVVQSPVQQDVTLHTETVVLERRKPILTSNNDVLTEVTVEMSDFNEVPVVSKTVHLVEEVLLRKEVTARIETIRDTVRRDTLEIEQPSNLPVVFNPAAKQAEKKREESTELEVQDKKQSFNGSQTANKADQKRS